MKRILLTSASVLVFATAAAAQGLPKSAKSDQNSIIAAPAETSGGIAEIVVTAARRSENIQRAALSIQALSSEALARANITRAEDLNNVAPGVAFGTAGAYPQIYIRGVGNYGTQAFSEGAVALNLDGVYISRGWASRGMFYDLERVEILKGPQGTLYGRNASGGAINVITAKPKFDRASGFAELEAGNYDTIQGSAAVNVPLNDKIAARVSGQIVSKSGYLSDGYNDEKTQSGRLQFLFKPSDDVSLLLNGNYQHAGGRGAGPVLNYPRLPGDRWRGGSDPAVVRIIRGQPGTGAVLAVPGTDGFLDTSVYAIGAELNWNLDFATFTLVPAYRDSTLNNNSYVSGFHSENHEHDQQTSVEARLANDGEHLKWVLGAFFFNEHQTPAGGNPLSRVLQGINANRTANFDQRVRSYAAFSQGTYSLTDRLRLTAGLRYTYERKTLSGTYLAFARAAAPPAPICAAGRVLDTVTEPPFSCRQDIPVSGRLTYNNVTYKAGAEYDLAPQSMAYASVSTGFKSGGFFNAPPPNTFKPEKMTAFELGVKNRFLDNKLQVNLETFYWRYRDHQESHIGPTSVPGYFTFLTENAGRAESYGADLDVVVAPTTEDELKIKIEYNKTKYNTFQYSFPTGFSGAPVVNCGIGPLIGGSQAIDCSGKSLVRAPVWSGTVGYSHVFDLGNSGQLTASADVQFASSAYLAIDFLNSERQKSYAVENFDLTYQPAGGRWTVSAYVDNIGNEAVMTNVAKYPFVSGANPLTGPEGVVMATLRPPRTFGGRVHLNF